ncbi:hypothetical protein FOA52_010716 [Chlamydomonas sp. UWO 241]|nr:hypothetical protein FOA52_010716 [Chlamydomonas sp. UWO 241]
MQVPDPARCAPSRLLPLRSSSMPEASTSCDPLVDWVLAASGYMHPSMRVVEEAPCGGGRGLIMTEDLDLEAVTGMPMLLVPEDLLLTSEVARHGFASHYEPQGAPPLGELDEVTQLAVMLAHERLDGDASFYAPYVSSLPHELPCAWALPPDELEARLQALAPRLGREGVDAWRAQVDASRASMQAHAAGAVARYGSFFPLEADVFTWAMGTVLSRAFSSPTHLSLLPLIDLCNHRQAADHPEPIALGGDEDDVCFCVSSLSGAGDAAWRPLRAGDELLIRYFDTAASQPLRQPAVGPSSSSLRGAAPGTSDSLLGAVVGASSALAVVGSSAAGGPFSAPPVVGSSSQPAASHPLAPQGPIGAAAGEALAVLRSVVNSGMLPAASDTIANTLPEGSASAAAGTLLSALRPGVASGVLPGGRAAVRRSVGEGAAAAAAVLQPGVGRDAAPSDESTSTTYSSTSGSLPEGAGSSPGAQPGPGSSISSSLQGTAASSSVFSSLPEGAASTAAGALLAVPQPDALLCFLSHGCVFPELWVGSASSSS